MEVPPPTAEPLRQLNLPSGAAVQNTNKCEEENMKRKTMALMLALSMCLSLLSACGSGNTATDDKPPESENVVSSTEQPEESEKPEESKEQPEESEEPKEEEPEKLEEPIQEEPKEENNAGTAFLKLLQEEYKNGFVEGERPGCTYYASSDECLLTFINNGVVYIWDMEYGNERAFSYDIASKSLSEIEIGIDIEDDYCHLFVLNDTVYCMGELSRNLLAFDYNGILQKTVTGRLWTQFDKGILVQGYPDPISSLFSYDLYSYDFEKIAEIPATVQRDAEHGLKEEVQMTFTNMFAADGTVYSKTAGGSGADWCRLNTDTYEWEISELTPKHLYSLDDFCGKYARKSGIIYDRVTGEQVFECGTLHGPAYGNLCYFGGDKYLGYKNYEYRWVNLTDLSMSDPLPFPRGKAVTILNDTYCVYEDEYGWFLWNYNTGEEETIVLFEQ